LHVLSDPITDSAFHLQPPYANAVCVGVGCKTVEVKTWCSSKYQIDATTGKGLPMCGPCSEKEVRIHPTSIHSTVFPASDPPLPLAAEAGRRQVREMRLLRPEPVEVLQDTQEGGWHARSPLHVPLLEQGEVADQEGAEGGLIPLLLPPDMTAAPPHHPRYARPHRSPAAICHLHTT